MGVRVKREIGRLTALGVSKAKRAGMYADGGGLYLQVGLSGTKSWIYRFALNGRAREMGLGPCYDVPLADAREKAAACRRLKREGVDPIEARVAERRGLQLEEARAITFENAAESYVKTHKAGWRNTKHAERTSYPGELAEMALAHTVSNKVEAAYRRGDLFQKRRRLMNEWARYCAAPKEPDTVMKIGRRE